MSWLRYVPSIDLQQFSNGKITHQSSLEKAKWCQTSCQVGDSTSKNSEKWEWIGKTRAGTLTIGMWPVGIDRQKVEVQLNQKRIGMWPKKRSNK
jgi:hypothetical protein